MYLVKQIICLSNSKKLGERCIAGIDIHTGRWIRPVYDSEDGSVPRATRLIEGKEPKLLDIIEIPLAVSGKDSDFVCENILIIPGQWKLRGKAYPTDVVKYCRNTTDILHNHSKYVKPSYLKTLPFSQRVSLQLVQTVGMTVVKSGSGWRGSLQTSNGKLTDAPITDVVLLAKLDSGYQLNGPLLVTVSLGLPHIPEWFDAWEGEAPCWKLITGVIEMARTVSDPNANIPKMPRPVSEPDFDDIPF